MGNNNFKKENFFYRKQVKIDDMDAYSLSVRKDNVEAISFYNQNGYKVEFENSKSIYYIKEI